MTSFFPTAPTQDPITPKKSIFSILFYLGGFLAADILVAILFAVIYDVLGKNFSEEIKNPIIIQLLSLTVMLVRGFFIIYLLKPIGHKNLVMPLFRPLPFSVLAKWAFSGWLIVFISGVFIQIFATEILGLPPLKDQNPIRIMGENGPTFILAILFFINVVIFAPLIEEIIIRGFILNRLNSFTKSSVAIIVSSFLFGLIHFQLSAFPTLFIMGLVTAYATLRTRSLMPAIGIHILNNSFVFFAVLSA